MTTQTPLADRIRPRTLDDFVGQEHLVGPGKPLRILAETGQLRSMILWGPPGVGKTTLARILAQETGRAYHELSAVSAGKKDLVAIVEGVQAAARPKQRDLFSGLDDGSDTGGDKGAVLFLDEIHRFNKAQQDFLLPYVEDGTLVLIGATTENPSFEVISALLSRSQVFVLKALGMLEMLEIVGQGAAALEVEIDEEATKLLARYADGDARKALNLLEASAELYGGMIGEEQLRDALQSKQLRYDKGGDAHYDTISAYIKSMRASDPDAALYYLARMVESGEDLKFIARRLVIFASEDVGMAAPTALVVANAVFRAVEIIGLPEAGINLAHGTVYCAMAPKNRDAYQGYKDALKVVRETGSLSVPMHLRNAPTDLMKELGYAGERGDASNLPEEIGGRRFYKSER